MRLLVDHQALAEPLADLEMRRRLFELLPLDPTHAAWIRQRAWVRTVHGTARIEGNTASDIEVEALLRGDGATGISEREAREIIGTRDALDLVDQAATTGVPVDEALIREINRRVLWQQSPLLTPGEYRRGENRVVGADGTPIFRTPASGDVPERMRALVAWLASDGDDLPPPVVAALVHLEFVAIHPFNDGNGRTARAIARSILLRGGYAMGGLVSIDAQLDLDRVAYFGAIRDSTGQDYTPGYDATPFVHYFVRALSRAADHVLERIRGLGQVMVEIRRAIVEGGIPPSMIDGLAFAWVNRHLRAGDYIRITGRSPQNTTRDLDRAVGQGWLLATGERRGRYYVLGPRLLRVVAPGELGTPG